MEFLITLIIFVFGTISLYKDLQKKKNKIMKNAENRGGYYKDQSDIDFMEEMKHPIRYAMLNIMCFIWCAWFGFLGVIYN